MQSELISKIIYRLVKVDLDKSENRWRNEIRQTGKKRLGESVIRARRRMSINEIDPDEIVLHLFTI